MTPREAKEFVRRKVIECVPSILDLKLGCRFNLRKGRQVAPYVWDSAWKEEDGLIKFVDQEDLYDDKWTVEIIGRELNLADILNALPKYGLEFSITANFLYMEYVTGKNDKKHCEWELACGFDNQSPETWVALAEMMR